MKEDIDLTNKIDGRVKPQIYAFETRTVPNFLKIGDTYRPLYKRIAEWKSRYEDLKEYPGWSAVIGEKEEEYFRDYSVHDFVIKEKNRTRITDDDFKPGVYHSNEFFRDATPHDVEAAIDDIKKDYKDNTCKYTFYKLANIQAGGGPTRPDRDTEYTKLRPLQKEVVEKFDKAVNVNHRTNLLMYAVMRFGKSLTAMECAKVLPDCKLVVIVSAKADVKDGWCDTICRIKNFEDFDYIDSEDFKGNPHVIGQKIAEGRKVAACLTLQDTSEYKDRYDDLFHHHKIDLLIVDESHFGARAEKFGKVLQFNHDDKKKEQEYDDKDETADKLDSAVSGLDRRVTLHLSGTPYRILMNNEFSDEDIICKCTYPDLIEASEKWDREYLDSGRKKENSEDYYEEWDNPYYGFPQMVRFAFNFNKSSMDKLEELKKQGKDYSFDELFRTRDEGRKCLFIYEKEVLDFLKAINSGDNDENIMSFLDNERLKEGKLCHHVVMVLPKRAACDAMKQLIESHPEIRPLSSYVIIQATGKSITAKPARIRDKIHRCELNDEKTITLTVGKMLTGTTVPEWDTMFFLRGCSSPQEYDQATYRLQNQFIREYKSPDKKKVIRYNMKPQTLLVDFSPDRLYKLQEHRAFVSNILYHKSGTAELEEEIKREMDISPILCLNAHKLCEMESADILDEIRRYSHDRSILDEALEIGTDSNLEEDEELRKEIMRYAPIDTNKSIMTKAFVGGEETDADIPDDDRDGDGNPTPPGTSENKPDDKKEDDSFEKRQQMYYSHILFFAYLTNDRVQTLEDVCSLAETPDNERILKHLDIKVSILHRLKEKISPYTRRMLDFKIANINKLSHDTELKGPEKVESAMKQFGRWSESEIVTPSNIASDMMALIPEAEVDENFKFLDIASKEGEFANAIWKRFGDKVKNSIYSIPTSGVAYEFTRKVYQELGLPIENILTGNQFPSDFTSYDLIGPNKEQHIETLKNMNFNAIVGNPPYQDKNGSGGTNDAPIFQDFARVSIDCTQRYSSMIIKAVWYSAGRKGLVDGFRRRMLTCGNIKSLYTINDSSTVFKGPQIEGGLCYYLYDSCYDGTCDYTLESNGERYHDNNRKLDEFNILIKDPRLSAIVSKVLTINNIEGNGTVDSIISRDTPFGIPTKPTESKKIQFEINAYKNDEFNIELHYNVENRRFITYIRRCDIVKNSQDIDYPKIFIPEARGTASNGSDVVLGQPIIATPESVCSQTYLYAKFSTMKECENFASYIRTKFFRVLVSAAKINQHAPRDTYKFVPLQGFSEPWTDEKLYKKYDLTQDEIAYIESLIKPME